MSSIKRAAFMSLAVSAAFGLSAHGAESMDGKPQGEIERLQITFR